MNPTSVTKDLLNTYTITDTAGHTTKLFFQKNYMGKVLSLAKLTAYQYDNASKTPVSNTNFTYSWFLNDLSTQSYSIVGNFTLNANYTKMFGKTTVTYSKTGTPIQMKDFPGLYIAKVKLRSGVVLGEIQECGILKRLKVN